MYSTRLNKWTANKHITPLTKSRIRRHVYINAICIKMVLILKVRTYTNKHLKQDEMKICFILCMFTLETKVLVLPSSYLIWVFGISEGNVSPCLINLTQLSVSLYSGNSHFQKILLKQKPEFKVLTAVFCNTEVRKFLCVYHSESPKK
jgi:hypothetical protein